MNDKPDKPTESGATPPAVQDPNLSTSMALIGRHASPALQIMLDPALFDRAKLIATYMARAEGMIPRHLIGKTEACFAVVVRSITWKLDPFAVATCTYQTPGGSVGFEGKLCQAVLENSGKLEGPIRFTHYGDWSKVQGKFEIATSGKGNQFAKATWTDADAKGLGVTVSAKVVGEPEPREWSFDLIQAYPRNSTLWATDPKTQICYTAVRRFANVAAPGLFMGVPFDRDEAFEFSGPDTARDITPQTAGGRPRPEEYQEQDQAPAKVTNAYEFVNEHGEVLGVYAAREFDEALGRAVAKLGTEKNRQELEQIWLNNVDTVELLFKDGEVERASDMREFYAQWHTSVSKSEAEVSEPQPGTVGNEASSAPEPEPQADDTEADDIEKWVTAEPPTEIVWVSTNGRKNSFDNLEKWVTAVSAALGRCPDMGMLNTSRKNNAAMLAEYHALGDPFAGAVERIEQVFSACEEKLKEQK